MRQQTGYGCGQAYHPHWVSRDPASEAPVGSAEECALRSPVRPRFFCGQLLSERDLTAATDWARQKFELQRYKFGWGVVCGLNVCVHPYDRGKIVVYPGYAVDPCGRDIVVPCVQEIDLPDPRAGRACSCAEEDDSEDVPSTRRAINLCLCYKERPTEPRAGASIDACRGQKTCDYSRIVESFEFRMTENAKPTAGCSHHANGDTPPCHKRIKVIVGDTCKKDEMRRQIEALQREHPACRLAFLNAMMPSSMTEEQMKEFCFWLELDSIVSQEPDRACAAAGTCDCVPLARISVDSEGLACLVDASQSVRRHFSHAYGCDPLVDLGPWLLAPERAVRHYLEARLITVLPSVNETPLGIDWATCSELLKPPPRVCPGETVRITTCTVTPFGSGEAAGHSCDLSWLKGRVVAFRREGEREGAA